jgi:23S rRNA pseudouridine2604 synthase
MKINEFLIKRYRLSQEESVMFLQKHDVLINNQRAIQRQTINKRDALCIDGELVREWQTFVHYAFYKPRGIECTLHPEIEDNLCSILPFEERVYPIGRLDKESEGLLILTNDGCLYKEIAFAGNFKEKEYEVRVNHALTETSIRQLSQGIVIKGKKTRPALVRRVDENSFNIVLTQGINRQIRRMCYKLGYEVTSLRRLRIASVTLGDLQPGQYKKLTVGDIF